MCFKCALIPLDDKFITPEEKELNFTFFIDNLEFSKYRQEAMKKTKAQKLTDKALKTLWIGIRELSAQEEQMDWNKLPIPYPSYDKINTTFTYRGFTTSCNFINEDLAEWSTEGCRVSICFSEIH